MLTIRVRSPDSMAVINISAAETTLTLKERIAVEINISKPFDLMGGFPPAIIPCNSDTTVSQYLSSGESIRVQYTEVAGQCIQVQSPPAKSKKRKVTSSSSSPSVAGCGVTSVTALKGFGAGKVVSLDNSSDNKVSFSSSKGKSYLSKTVGAGAVIAAAAAKKATQRKKAATTVRSRALPRRNSTASRAGGAGTAPDLAEVLVQAASGGGAGGVSAALRKVYRNAVYAQYDISLATARLSAVYAQSYRISESEGARLLGSGASTRMKVSFPSGPGARSYTEEIVELLPEDLLNAVVKEALRGDDNETNHSNRNGSGGDADRHDVVGDDEENAIAAENSNTSASGCEVLKPMNLARLSPRIFWSLVHRYGASITDSIKYILRDIDPECSWLDERKRSLSAKAQANLKQQEQKEAQLRASKRRKTALAADKSNNNSNSTSDTSDTAANEGTTHGSSRSSSSHDSTMAAMSSLLQRAVRTIGALDCSTVVPKQWLPSLLCDYSAPPPLPHGSGGDATRCTQEAVYVSNLLCSRALRDRIIEHQRSTPPNSASASADVNRRDVSLALSLDQLDFWISAVQGAILQRVWCVVCGGGSQRLRRALHKLRVRTPKELLVWRNGAEGLLQGLLGIDPGLGNVHFYWLDTTTTATNSASNRTINSTSTTRISSSRTSDEDRTLRSIDIDPDKTEEDVKIEEKQQEKQQEKQEEEEEEEEEEPLNSSSSSSSSSAVVVEQQMVFSCPFVDNRQQAAGIAASTGGSIIGRYVTDTLTVERIHQMCEMCSSDWMTRLIPWIENYQYDDDFGDDDKASAAATAVGNMGSAAVAGRAQEEEEDEEEDEDEEREGWIRSSEISSIIGRRVRCIIEDIHCCPPTEDSTGDNLLPCSSGAAESVVEEATAAAATTTTTTTTIVTPLVVAPMAGSFWWQDGSVVAYLPAQDGAAAAGAAATGEDNESEGEEIPAMWRVVPDADVYTVKRTAGSSSNNSNNNISNTAPAANLEFGAKWFGAEDFWVL